MTRMPPSHLEQGHIDRASARQGKHTGIGKHRMAGQLHQRLERLRRGSLPVEHDGHAQLPRCAHGGLGAFGPAHIAQQDVGASQLLQRQPVGRGIQRRIVKGHHQALTLDIDDHSSL